MSGNFWQSSHYQQWLLDRQDLIRERQADLAVLTEEEYQKLMIFFANFIQILGEHLKVKQQVISTAIVYFKRFYLRNSLKSIDPLLMSPTCILLASKVEEFGVISNNRLISTCQTVIKNKFAYAYPNEFTYRMNHVLECEFYLLELMDCCLILYHPYRPLLQYMQDIKEFKEIKDPANGGSMNTSSSGSNSNNMPNKDSSKDDILNISWTVANDTYRTDIPLLYPPHLIAIACLHVACVIANKESYKQWFAELNVDFDKNLEITRHILNLYEMWKSFDEKKRDWSSSCQNAQTQNPAAIQTMIIVIIFYICTLQNKKKKFLKSNFICK